MKNTISLIAILLLGLSTAHAIGAPNNHRGAPKAVVHKPLAVMPKSHKKIVYKGKSYFYTGGRFYRHANGVYVNITAPIGVTIPTLPSGFVTIGTGSNRFFYFGGIYYRQHSTGYTVIERPIDAPDVLPPDDSPLIAYPAGGQSEEQQGRDRYECHLWASSETGFDPTSSASELERKKDYIRAMSACLEAHNYVTSLGEHE